MYQVFLAGNSVPVTLILMDVIVMFPLESPFPFFFSSFHVHLCYELNEFLIFCFFVFSLVLFDGLIITSSLCFVNIFLYFYSNIFIYYLFYILLFYYLFVFFIIFC